MKLYHGSRTGNIKTLIPKKADHEKAYVYLTTIEAVAAIYLCNPMEKPHYWFPYGFEKDSHIPIYHEIYRDALRDVSQNVSGYIYEVELDEERLSPLPDNPCAFVSTVSLPVCRTVKIPDAYSLLLEHIEKQKLKVSFFEDKTEKQLDWWYRNLISSLQQRNMADFPDCSYARFIQTKLPQVWSQYILSVKS